MTGRRRASRQDASPSCTPNFKEALARVEEERLSGEKRAHDGPRSWTERMKDRALCWLAEKIAEQRLLWRLRNESELTLHYPDDVTADTAIADARAELQREADRHLKWIIIDGTSVRRSPACSFWCLDRTSSRTTSASGSSATTCRGGAPGTGSREVRWQSCPSPQLSRLRRDRGARPHERDREVHEVASAPAAAASGEILRPNLGRRPRDILRSRRDEAPDIMTLSELAERLGCRLEGDGSLEIRRVAGLEQAGEGDITFFANPKYAPALRRTRASAVILGESAPAAPCAMLRTKHPYLAFANALSVFVTPAHPPPGIATLSAVAADAILGRDVSIGPFSSIGRGARVGDRTVIYPNVCIGDGAVIGDDCVIHSHAAIRERVVLGNRVVLQNGAVIGGDGYGFVRRPDGTHQKIPQTSIVVIEDDVEIGANTDDRSAGGRRDAHSGRREDRQPRADRTRRQRRDGTRCWPRRSASPAARRSATT